MKKLLLVATLLGFSIHLAHAQVTLLDWSFSGTSGDQVTDTADTFGTNISNTGPSGVLSRGSGINAATNNGRFNANSWTQPDIASALANNDYFTFSVAPNSGFSMTLTSIVFDMQRSTTGPTSFTLFSSVDGFTIGNDEGTLALPGETNNDLTFNLGSEFENLTGSVEFRFYGYGNGASQTTGSAGFEGPGVDLELLGTTAVVPEPSTYALIFGGVALGFVVWRKKRKTAT